MYMSTPPNASAELDSNQTPSPFFGLAVGAGDVNGDGFADVAVGARKIVIPRHAVHPDSPLEPRAQNVALDAAVVGDDRCSLTR